MIVERCTKCGFISENPLIIYAHLKIVHGTIESTEMDFHYLEKQKYRSHRAESKLSEKYARKIVEYEGLIYKSQVSVILLEFLKEAKTIES